MMAPDVRPTRASAPDALTPDAPAPGAPASRAPEPHAPAYTPDVIRVSSSLAPRDVARVSAVLVLRHPVSVMLLVVGPLWLAIGLATGHGALTRLGATLTWLTVLVPAFAFFAGAYNAYRPGSKRVYDPAQWDFAEDAVGIVLPRRVARAEWGEFLRWRSAAGCLLLHTSRRSYIVIPWRDVPSGEVDRLQDLLTRRVGKRRR